MLFALAAGSWASVQSGPQPEHVYSLATVTTGFVRHPAEWAGRTVLVRATVVDFQHLWRSLSLMGGETDNPRRVLLTAPLGPQNLGTTTLADVTSYAGAVSHGNMLSVLTRSPGPLLTFLRQVPGVSWLVPPPQRGDIATTGIYRVQLAPLGQSCLLLRSQQGSGLTPHWRRLLFIAHSPRWQHCYDGILADYVS